MRQRVSLITLGVRDLARARGFYEALGWQTGAGPDDDVVFFQAGDMVVALWDRARLAEDSCVEDAGGWGGTTLALNFASPEEVDAAIEEARAAGATIGREPAETFWGGYSAVFLDPEGHPWEVAHNPHWTITEDGATRLGQMELESWHAPPGDGIPNHPRFAVLIYRGTGLADAGAARERFAAHGWRGAWVDGVFDFHHFHSTSHEVLAVVAGHATLELGGPQGRAFEVSVGDVAVLPAGTGHRRASAGGGFTVVGAYPAGQEDYDLLRGDDPAEVAAARERIAALPAPPDDPVGGDGVASWR